MHVFLFAFKCLRVLSFVCCFIQYGLFVRSFAVEISNVWLHMYARIVHTHTHTRIHIHTYTRARACQLLKQIQLSRCVRLCVVFLWFTFQAESTYRSNSLSFGDQFKWKQKQATTVSKRTLYWSRHTLRNEIGDTLCCDYFIPLFPRERFVANSLSFSVLFLFCVFDSKLIVFAN